MARASPVLASSHAGSKPAIMEKVFTIRERLFSLLRSKISSYSHSENRRKSRGSRQDLRFSRRSVLNVREHKSYEVNFWEKLWRKPKTPSVASGRDEHHCASEFNPKKNQMMPESVCFDEFFYNQKKRNFRSAFSVNIKQRRIAKAIADGAHLIKDSSAKQTRRRGFEGVGI